MISASSWGQQEEAAILLPRIIDVTSAVFLSSVILAASQKTPAEVLARNPCVCQGRVIGTALITERAASWLYFGSNINGSHNFLLSDF